MGEDICLSEQREIHNQYLNSPGTILTIQNKKSNPNFPNYNNIKNLKGRKINKEYLKTFIYKNYKMEKSQLMYVKKNIQQKYNPRNNHKNKINKIFTNTNINNFSLEIKPEQKYDLKINNFNNKNLSENFNYNKTIIGRDKSENHKSSKYTHYYNGKK